LRSFLHPVELRDQLSELSNLFLKFGAVRHTPPCTTDQVTAGGPLELIPHMNRPAHTSG
jgi:hypothetical protein